MKFNLCSACQFFQPRLLTEEKSVPKSCMNPKFSHIFGPSAKGFPSGIDIIHCDGFTQQSIFNGDYMLSDDGCTGLSYVLSSHDAFLHRIPHLTDNSKNIKIIPIHEKHP